MESKAWFGGRDCRVKSGDIWQSLPIQGRESG